jgi:hypothetical protein
MEMVIAIINYMSGPAATWLHQGAVLLALTVAVGFCLLGGLPAARSAETRLLAATGAAFAVALTRIGLGALAVFSALDERTILPPLERAAACLLALFVVWSAALPGRLRWADWPVAGLLLAAVAALGLSWADWVLRVADTSSVVFYNKTAQETAWEAAQIVLLAAGAIWLFARRPAAWAHGLAALLVLLAGHLLQFRFPPDQADFAGAVRIAEVPALLVYCGLVVVRLGRPAREGARVKQVLHAEDRTMVAGAGPIESRPAVVAQARAAFAPEPAPDAAPPEPSSEAALALLAARADRDRLAAELADAQGAADHLRRRAEALAEQEHSRLEEIAGLRAELEAARQAAAASAQAGSDEDAARREAETQRERADRLDAELEAARAKLADVEGQLEAMRPQLETLDRLWVELQVAQKQAEERSRAEPAEPNLAGQLAEASARLAQALADREQATAQVESYAAQLADARDELLVARDEAARLAGKLDKARAKGERLSEEVEDAITQLALHRDEIAALADQEQQRADEAARLQSQLEEALRRNAAQAEARVQSQAELETARRQLEAARAELEQKRQAEIELDKARYELSETRARLEAANEELAARSREVEAARQRETEARSATDQIAADREAARARIESLSVHLENQRAETQLLADQLRARLDDIALLREQLRISRLGMEERQRLKDEADTSRAQLEALEAIGRDLQEWHRRGAAPALEPEAADKPANGSAAPPVAAEPNEGYGSSLPGVEAAPTATAPAQAQPPAAPSPEGAVRNGDKPMAAGSATRVFPLEAAVSACPRLGTAEDADTHYTFVSPVHRCYALANPAEITNGQQSEFCLGPEHARCPLLAGQVTAPALPIDTRVESGEARARRRGGFGWLAGRKPQGS